ncbi:DNA-dependent ATPase protein rad54 [Coemansia sp. RSA 989]|nr:DNA-dependent ATPase protein rad54 [Coemansia sp. RSA 1086]KAJ1753575.1 DNA-dependent ATPase protein rad54 [Coemansia sp. RSA 1821]KAJ1868603.1 DNA-dependent ATPase protein rad54 [Coemansia sp. RSA 989]KAJ1876215.1 DNA-dependent ATPase protein rad54 [Coemansia sp. RSA 990]KAJ2675804.1 DNA-dependent ATPase protein rad54 [Coemansia sp. RSA 1085]
MSLGVAAQLPNRRLLKPFVSPSKSKSAVTGKPMRSSLKRLFSVRKTPSLAPSKRPKLSDTSEKDSSNDDADEPCLPGINYNGMSKKLFKPFRPPAVRQQSSDSQSEGGKSDDTAVRPGVRGSLGVRRRLGMPRGPRYNPDTEDAVVLYRPPEPSQLQVPDTSPLSQSTTESDSSHKAPTAAVVPASGRQNKSLKSLLGRGDSTEQKLVPVVVDPALGRKLRPHQIEGVRFLYNCATGQVYPNAFGSIMADEMGLGKTLQCIALLWTLLQQSPVGGKPTIEKCIVACPSSLVKNWANELVKWLGSTKISPLACDNKGTKEKVTASLRSFINARGRMIIHPVLIISYETLRTYIDILKSAPVGLLMCDEGHRLKNSNSQTYQALNSLQVQRRIILSGTPIQNDLTEYFSLLNFTNPGLLGSTAEFRRTFELPILRGRDAMATEREQQLGDQRLSELNAIASKVIIRRTNDLLSKYLPIKYEHVVFCPLTDLQTDLYELFLKSKEARTAIGEGGQCSLQTIISLGKLCNHPGLLDFKSSVKGYADVTPKNYFTDSVFAEKSSNGRSGALGSRRLGSSGSSQQPFHPKWSSKMALLDRMLQQISTGPERDKIVLISNYTQTLDLFETLCRARSFGYYRLDGSMTISKRQTIVDQFNDPKDRAFVFLLSSKAGGCGINLVGANRLVLFDSSFNPADNLQACGRIWRDGQKKPCFIYTFVTTGTVEEKIFQRQSYKTSLSTCVIDEQENVERHFSRDQMRQLFQAKLRGQTDSETHDQFKCRRCVRGRHAIKAAEPMDFADHNSWDHFSSHDRQKIHDSLLKSCMGKDVSFVFQYKSHNNNSVA